MIRVCLHDQKFPHSFTADKIIASSFQGYVRIYDPRPVAYDETHMLLERQMAGPVLQVAAGKFVGYVIYNALSLPLSLSLFPPQ